MSKNIFLNKIDVSKISHIIPEKKELLGVPIHDTTLQNLVKHLNHQILDNKKTVVYGFSVTTLGRLKEIPEFFSWWEKADITVADGAGIPILAKLFGVHISEHIGLPNIAEEMIKLADEKHFKVLLFGATKETNKKAQKNLEIKYTNINFCEGIDGYFNKDDEANIIKKINKDNPDILLIGISSPIKERFVYMYRNRLKIKVIILCGGMIDVFAGVAKREPKIIKGLPLAWFYRFLQEPKRLLKPLILPGFRFFFCYFPVLFIKYFIKKEKNPSLKNLLNI